ncbi:hypothetical protein ACFPOE_19865 [Caenimonas terrae]|uniref:KTSC domain-containing protein n=1 Tax=Caenimonas terrae TaxID=696074 RepID=A0ABW0NLH0_9BURK
MKPYKNLSGKSGVVAYAVGGDYVDVKFRGRDEVYRYSERSAGKDNVAAMKVYAVNGRGLSTFISKAQPAHER